MCSCRWPSGEVGERENHATVEIPSLGDKRNLMWWKPGKKEREREVGVKMVGAGCPLLNWFPGFRD